MCFYCGRYKEFKDFFSQEDGVWFCNDVCSTVEVLVREYNPDQWSLYIESSKVSLKVVLLYNGNRFPSAPLADAANMKESYEGTRLLLGKVKYDEFEWKLCGDLKVVVLLLGMQLGYRKIINNEDVDILQKDLNRLGEWAVENRMKINRSKCKAIPFTRARVKDPLNYSLMDTLIPKESSCKYL